MSTILKSLKKLEKEKEGPTIFVPAPALITGAGAHQAIHRSVRFALLKGRIHQWGLIGAAFIVVFVIVLYAFNGTSPSKPPMAAAPKPSVQPVPKIEPQPPLTASVPEEAPPIPIEATETETVGENMPQPGQTAPAVSMLPMPVAQRPETEPVAISPSVAPPPLPKDGFEALGQKPAPSTMGAVPVQQRRPQAKPAQPQAVAAAKPKPMPGPAFFSEESLPGGLAPLTQTAPVAPAPKQSETAVAEIPKAPKTSLDPAGEPSGNQAPAQPQTTSQATPSKPEEAAFAGAERLTDGSLKVQAIVFAPAAEERMAVVNNTIVREGSAIQNYTIVGIGEENIFVREGQGRLLKVPFGKP